MAYTGNVTVGGDAQVHELTALIISKIAVGPYENNCYLLRCRRSGEQLLIDAADDPEALMGLVGASSLSAIVTTHSHADHWQALPALLQATGASTVAHHLDAPDLPVDTERLVDDGDLLHVGDVPLAVIHLRGHTPGGIALAYDDPEGPPHVFTGDSLFPGGVGKTTPATFGQLLDDVEQRVFARFPDETWIYPGHGKDTTLGAERPHLAEWRERGW